MLSRYCNKGRVIAEVKVLAPPPMNTMEQLLAVQNAISKVEEFVQDGNIFLLKLRALLLAGSSQVFFSSQDTYGMYHVHEVDLCGCGHACTQACAHR